MSETEIKYIYNVKHRKRLANCLRSKKLKMKEITTNETEKEKLKKNQKPINLATHGDILHNSRLSRLVRPRRCRECVRPGRC